MPHVPSLRRWWRDRVSRPLDAMYDRIDADLADRDEGPSAASPAPVVPLDPGERGSTGGPSAGDQDAPMVDSGPRTSLTEFPSRSA